MGSVSFRGQGPTFSVLGQCAPSGGRSRTPASQNRACRGPTSNHSKDILLLRQTASSFVTGTSSFVKTNHPPDTSLNIRILALENVALAAGRQPFTPVRARTAHTRDLACCGEGGNTQTRDARVDEVGEGSVGCTPDWSAPRGGRRGTEGLAPRGPQQARSLHVPGSGGSGHDIITPTRPYQGSVCRGCRFGRFGRYGSWQPWAIAFWRPAAHFRYSHAVRQPSVLSA